MHDISQEKLFVLAFCGIYNKRSIQTACTVLEKVFCGQFVTIFFSLVSYRVKILDGRGGGGPVWPVEAVGNLKFAADCTAG